MILRSWGRSSLIYSFKYNQQDATLYNILYYVNALHVSGGFSGHHQKLKNCKHSMGYMSSFHVATANVDELEFQLTHASGNNKQAWHIPDGVFTVFELLMMAGETAWNM